NVSAVATTLFLGGWRAPWPISAIGGGYFGDAAAHDPRTQHAHSRCDRQPASRTPDHRRLLHIQIPRGV
ncbi:MAG: hypothetical protein B7Z12_19965, partial [Caulobacter vibrioides]